MAYEDYDSDALVARILELEDEVDRLEYEADDLI